MAANFSVDPYHDDFDREKNYHRILFKPGVAVQARELTQSQTILQDQIQKFGDHIFKNYTIVSGAQTNVNFNVFYLKIKPFDRNNEEIIATNFVGSIVEDITGTIVGKVVASSEKILNEEGTLIQSPMLIISYSSGERFTNGQRIFVRNSNTTADTITVEDEILLGSVSGPSSVASISNGVFYIDGFFVEMTKQTTIINQFSSVPSARVGISISENVIDSNQDFSLLDPALGASNFQAPGADRYQIRLSLISKPLTFDGDSKFIELIKIENGKVQKTVQNTQYSIIDDYFARRTFDTNGDFVVNKFKVSAVQTPGSNASSNTFTIKVGPGKSYVRGYLVENQSNMNFVSNKARSNNSIINKSVFMNYGNYLNVYDFTGFFDFANYQQVDFHCTKTPNTTNLLTYNSTKAATARIRNIEFDSYTNVSNSKSFVYRTHLIDLQTNIVNGTSVETTINSIKFPPEFNTENNVYSGVYLRINDGVASGDVVKIANSTGNVAHITTSFIRIPENNCNFSLLYDTKDFESVYAANSAGIGFSNNRALIANSSKVNGLDSGDTFLLNKTDEELIYDIGDYIVQNSMTNTQYYASMEFNVINPLNPFDIPYPDVVEFTLSDGDYYSSINDNFICTVRKQSDNGNAKVGDILAFNSPTLGIRIDQESTRAQFIGTGVSDLVGATIEIFARIFVKNGNYINVSRKYKQIVSANVNYVKNFISTGSAPVRGLQNTYVDLVRGQTYIRKSEFNANSQSLYVADVKNIVKIIDTLNPAVNASANMVFSSTNDITRYFVFDNGQRDHYYDHASIKLLPNAPRPNGNILVLYNYYKHFGDGYFSVDSYPDNYEFIPSYTSKKGKIYALRDCVDFRKSRVANTADFELFSSTNTEYVGIPTDQTNFKTDFKYYLGRKDIVVITKDKEICLIEGIPSDNPQEPVEPEGSIKIAKINHDPYTSILPNGLSGNELSSVQIYPVEHKRWRMQDISNLEDRVSRVEYYTSLNALEQSSKNLQIPDELGLNRFKNGIVTDNFVSYKVSDLSNRDFKSSIQQLKGKLFATHEVKNFSLVLKDLYKSAGKLDQTIHNSLDYKVEMDGSDRYVCLPYTKVPAAIQKFASRTVNLNPFYVVNVEGVCKLNPPMDNWVSTSKLPDLLIVDPDLTIYQQSNSVNILTAGDWQAISSTQVKTDTKTSTDVRKTVAPEGRFSNFAAFTDQQLVDFMVVWELTDLSPNGLEVPFSARDRETIIGRLNTATVNGQPANRLGIEYQIETETTDTFIDTSKRDVTEGYYTEVKNGKFEYFDGFVTDVSINPYIRSQEIEFSAKGLLYNTYVSAFFDNVNVSDRIIQTNILDIDVDENAIIEPTDIIGSYNGSSWTPVAKIIDVQTSNNIIGYYRNLPPASEGKKRVRCQLVGDKKTRSYTNKMHSSLNCEIAVLRFDTNGNVASTPITANVASINRRSGEVLEVNTSIGFTRIRIPESYVGEHDDFDDSANTIPRFVGKNIICLINDWEGKFEITESSREENHPVYGNTIFLTCNNSVITGSTILGSTYTIKPNVETTGGLLTNEEGNVFGVFYLPENSFNTGEKIFRVDNRILSTESSETCFAQARFFAQSLKQQKQEMNFSADLDSAERVFHRSDESYVTRLQKQTRNRSELTPFTTDQGGTGGGGDGGTGGGGGTPVDGGPVYDPVAQTFIFYGDNYPYGCFIKSIKLFFRTKPENDDAPVYIYMFETQNGYPNGRVLPHGIASLKQSEIKVEANNPHYLDPNTYSEFVFNIPVYVKPETLYSFMVYTNSDEYNVWTANLGDNAVPSSVRNLPTDPMPSSLQRITKTPYVGELFLSQNTLTWSSDKNQDLMFVIERCDFDSSKMPTVEFIAPKYLPERNIVSDIAGYISSEKVIAESNSSVLTTTTNVIVDSFNVTTTDLTFENAPITYTYRSLIKNGNSPIKESFETEIKPGKYGAPSFNEIYLDDGNGERILDPLRDDSFSLYAKLKTFDSTISPFISETGVTLFAIDWKINNLGISLDTINVIESGNNYTQNPIISLTRTSNTGGLDAVLSANVVNGQIVGIDVVDPGSLYVTAPIITITDDNHKSSANANAVVVITGENYPRGGNAIDRYIQKPVVLAPGFDAGDLRVYYTAYRPLGTNIYVFYKISNRNDTQSFEDSEWQLMTTISGKNNYSKSREDLYEYVAAPGDFGSSLPDNKVSYISKQNGQIYTTFYKFAIKIVFASEDSTKVPFLTDVRGIALPEMI